MTANGISQTGIESDFINYGMNEAAQQTQSKTDKGKDDLILETDTVKIATNVSERSAIEFEALDEEKANILAQLVANALSEQTFGISMPAGTDALRTFM